MLPYFAALQVYSGSGGVGVFEVVKGVGWGWLVGGLVGAAQ